MKRIVPLMVAVAGLALLVQVTMNWHTIQGIVLSSLGKHVAAIKRFHTAVEENPDDLYAQFYLGQSYFDVGNFSLAIDHLRIATILVPSHHKARYLLGSSLAQDGQVDAAISAIKKAVEVSPGIALYHYSLGLLLKDQGAYPEALVAFKLALGNGMEDADLDFNRAYVYLRMAQRASARRLFQSTLNKNPEHFFARLELARMLADEHQLEVAILEYRLAVNSRPIYFLSQFELSRILRVDGQLEQAFAELDKARLLDPDNQHLHRSYFSLGLAFKEQKKLLTAIKALSIAADLADHVAEYQYQIGHLYRKLEMTDGAEKALARAIALNPRHPHVHPELAKVHIAQDRIDDAIHEFQTDIEISPGRFFSHYDLGLLYMKRQEFAAAKESLEKAVMINPDYPHTCAMLVEVYQSLALRRPPDDICNFETATR